MNIYLFAKVIHFFAAIALVGPLALAVRWLPASQEPVAKHLLDDLHLQTNIAGWIVFITAGVLLYMQHWAWINFLWIQISIALFVLVQIFDHFWADKREEQLAQRMLTTLTPLRTWLGVKLALYSGITFMVMLKSPL